MRRRWSSTWWPGRRSTPARGTRCTGSPRRRLGDAWLYRRRRFEGERFYRRVLRVPRWKDRVPEAGALFAGGVSKRPLPADELGGLDRFVVETRRAELGHWLAAAAGPLFVLWNPWPAAVVLVAYGLAANLPCVAIQRYNRLRAERVLSRRAARSSTRRGGRAPPAGPPSRGRAARASRRARRRSRGGPGARRGPTRGTGRTGAARAGGGGCRRRGRPCRWRRRR